ncbi:embryonic polarity protein dorsal isoform X3 [Plodia interpunctella]|uniref:embryonic polarity protein dorsal isoform X3 n=1 Tax=Plodia interpunctella TaxID=58824 RepID=UPI002368EA7C|nr:embryonic polarity protein dorsal-like isoform X3 [Plodia interpunctella]
MDIGGEGVSPAAVVDNVGDTGSHLNISDVFEVISHDYPTIGAGAALEDMSRPPGPHAGPYTRITEQPAGKALRFRYECEGRSAGSIPGVKSTPENRTYPTIMICGYKGRVVVVVSCVTKDEPFKPHPHNLVGRECQRGVCTVRETITEENCQVAFKNLGIQCVKRRDIAEALRVREELRVDPFKTRYHHKNQPQSIDLNAVRLCFQVFMTDEAGKVKHSLTPVVSDIIYDKKAMSDLQIAQISHCSGPMKGGTRVILLCEKVNREDTAVVFYQEENGQEVWRERAHIEAVHKQVAIVFHTPRYHRPSQQHVTVQLLLQRLTDGAKSTPVNFEYIPDRFCPPDAGYIEGIKRKRPPSILQDYDNDRGFADSKIKSEPRDKLSPRPINQFNDQWYEMAGPSVQRSTPPTQQWAWQGSPYQLQALSPSHDRDLHMQGTLQVPAMSPNMQQLDQSMSPTPSHMGHSPMGHVSPAMGHVSPAMGHVSPAMGHMSPAMGHVSPALAQMSPMQAGQMSPSSISPAMGQMSPGMMQQIPVPVPQQYAPIPQMMETGVDSTPSFTSLLQENAGAAAAVDSTELSIISSMFADRGPDLSDSLNRLSTSDLLQP